MITVTLQPMTADEVTAHRRAQLDGYIAQRVEFGGEDREVATRIAAAQHEEFFPGGVPAENHFLFTARDSAGGRVGVLWLFRRAAATVWIYDVEVDEACRGLGLGRALMLAAHEWAAAQGASAIELNVFGGNAVARGLYTSLGYIESSVHMIRQLREEP